MKRFIFVAVLAFFATVSLAHAFADEVSVYTKVEKESIIQNAQRSYIYANDGKILARLYLENREDVPLQNVAQFTQEAFIAIEDERFYKHNGVDYYGIARALVENIKSKQIVEGGSTITQQYVKNTIGKKDKTIERKIKEAVIAYRLEKKYSKRTILEAYLNTIYFGQGAYGIEAASEVFYGKKSYQLNLAESALLAGVTKSPLEYSPYFNPKRAYARQHLVLDRMATLGFITKEEAEAAKKTPLKIAPRVEEKVSAPYFVEHIKQQLIKEYGVEKVFKGGLRIYTTLDVAAQKNAERAVLNTLNLRKDPEAALVSLDPRNGHIIAMVGGRNYNNVKYNLATQGKRQPGSSFKMFVLVTALARGYSPNDTFNSSSPQVIRVSRSRYEKPWTVRNSEGHGYGMMTLREGTVNSVNTVYANVTMRVGAENVVKTAHKMGIKTPLDPYPAIGIGGLTIGVSPLEMASAYGTLAHGGVHVEPTGITRIEEPDGTIIKEVVPQGEQVVNRNVAYQATELLQGVIQRGTATRARIDRPAAGKTGTNQLYRDAWFVGYTPNMVTAVWMGHPKAQISMYSVHGRRGFGGIIPATIWRKYMSATLKGTPVYHFPKAKWNNRGGRAYGSSGTTKSASKKYKSKKRSYSRYSQSYTKRSSRSSQRSYTTPRTNGVPQATNPPATVYRGQGSPANNGANSQQDALNAYKNDLKQKAKQLRDTAKGKVKQDLLTTPGG